MGMVFVYGSLKTGGYNSCLMVGSEFIGRAHMCRKYLMVSLGPFPGLLYNHDAKVPASGEVYKVSKKTLKRLDQLEGHPNFCRRKRVWVNLGGGKKVRCWVYFYNQPIHPQTVKDRAVASGHWPCTPVRAASTM